MIYLGLNDSYNKIELKWQMKAFLIVIIVPASIDIYYTGVNTVLYMYKCI